MIKVNDKYFDWIPHPKKEGKSIIISYWSDWSFDDYEAEVDEWKELEYIREHF